MGDFTNKVCSKCGAPAVHRFKNGNYCCSKKYQSCPDFKRKMVAARIKTESELLHPSKTAAIRREVQEGQHKCKYCDRIARFVISNYTPCCQPKARFCDGFHKTMSKNRIQYYKDNPDVVEAMKETSKEVHSRPGVIESKSNAMKLLHSGDCIPCREFQENYKQGRIKFRQTLDKKKEFYNEKE